MKINIRQEQVADYEKVYELVKLAFASSAHSDGTEADYLNALRKKDTFVPELALVAEDENGQIVGQIVLSETNITAPGKIITELVLSPLCVHPRCFRQGLARKLTERAFELAKRLGYQVVLLCGAPEIYRKLGFQPSYEYNIYHVADKNAEWCMARELCGGALENISGTVDIV